MKNFLIKGKNIFLFTILLIFLFLIHQSLIKLEYFLLFETPLKSIYLFNYLALIIFLVTIKLNSVYRFMNSLAFFIMMTVLKMFFIIGFFVYFIDYGNYDIKTLVYNFFPLYFLMLIFEIYSIKKSLINI